MIKWFSKNIFYPLWDIKDGSHRLKALKELEKTQWLSLEKLRDTQWKKLINILVYAYDNCIYYKETFDKHGIHPLDIKTPQDFFQIPLLTKKQIQQSTDALISKMYIKNTLASAKTGGSTGKALTIYFDKNCVDMRIAAALRSDRWAGWELGMKKAAIWGNPPLADTLKKKIRKALLDRVIYLDTMKLNNESLAEFVLLFKKYQPSVIFGHAHSIFMFAKFVRDKKITDILPRGIISSSMMLIPHERTFIENTFNCKITNRYGCEEVGLIACECNLHDGMHLNIDHLYIEFLKSDGSPAKEGEDGNIVVTDLMNRGMPLIRYKIEDHGVPSDRTCKCGRSLPLMERIVGRTADFLITEEGALVAGISLIERTLTAINGIEQMQIIQDAINKFILNIVPQETYNEACETMLINEMKIIFGKNITININRLGSIPQEQSGKYRFAICNIN